MRIIDRENSPDNIMIRKWVGNKNFKYWQKLLNLIEENYSGVFKTNDWIYGGKKYGWGLRFKKSVSFCTLIPERNRLLLQIVFGAKEREKIKTILTELNPEVRKKYQDATTYHDGKWLVLAIDSKEIFNDVRKLFSIKRKPNLK